MDERFDYENNGMDQNDDYNRQDNDPVENFTEKNAHRKHGRRGGMMRKTASIASLALVFGLVSGGAFQAVNAVSSAAQAKQEAQEEEATETVASAVKAMSSSSETTAAATQSSTTASGEMSVSDVAEKVLPSIVAINCTGTTTVSTVWGNAQEDYTSCGTGIIVGESDTELLIATNNHVVADSNTVSVDFCDETSADALIKGTDEDNDLAVIAVELSDISSDTLSQISIAELGNFDDVKVGESVVAIGNALGYGQSVTTGVVSALNREVTTEEGTTNSLLQTDAAINPGNSGGALCNMQGQVIAINSAKYSDTSVEGMGYAIPISTASPILDELMNRETRTVVDDSESSWLGIQGQDISDTVASSYNMPAGIYVTGISEDSPAAAAGMQTGDIITKFDGTSVDSITSLKKLMTYYASGETVTVTVKRVESGEYVEKELSVTLGHQDSTTTESSESNENSQDPAQNGQNSQNGQYGYSYGSGSNGSFFGNYGSYGTQDGSNAANGTALQ